MGSTAWLLHVRRFVRGPVAALVAACLALAGVVLTLTAGPRTAGAVDGQPSGTVTKVGRDLTTGSSTEVGAGDTIRWTVSARNTSGVPADVEVTDPVGAGQTFLPGSLQAPPGYRRQWSTNHGASYADTDQGTATNQVRVSAADVIDQSTGAANQIPAPATNFGVGNVGGDGWEALFWDDKVFNVHHHHGTGGDTTFFDCHFKSGGQSCPGFPPGGTNVSATAGTPVSIGTDDYNTPEEARSIVSSAGRMYTPVQITNSTSTGFACVNLAVSPPVSCGFLAVAANAPLSVPGGGSGASALGGGAVVGSKLYSMTWDGRLACVDSSTGAFCAGSTDGIVGTIDPGVAGRSGNNRLLPSQHAQFTTVRGVIAGIADTQSGQTARNNVDIVCYDLNTNARCPGFPLVDAQPIFAGSAAPVLTTSGALSGVCTQSRFLPYPVFCYNLAGDAIDDPYPPPPAGTTMGAFAVGDPVVLGTRVYSPYSDTQTQNYYRCFDFATAALCAGFTTNHTTSTARPYTLRQDPYLPNCIWELGDGGIFENFEAGTGDSGCSDTAGEVAVNPAPFYCDGGTGHVQAWGTVSIANLPSTRYDSATITVLDSDGHPVSGFVDRPLPADGQLSLSSIPVTGATASLRVQLRILGANPAAWQGTPKPTAVLTFTGDAPQVCMRTTAATICNAVPATLSNTATLMVTAAGSSASRQASAALAYLFPTEDCPRRLEFTKQADRPTAAPGDTVNYTITVRNTGLVDFTAASPATFTDNLSRVLDDAVYNNDATATAGTVSYATPVLSWSGPLAAGATATIRYSVTINKPDTGDHRLTNTVVGTPGVENNCPAAQPQPACTATVPVTDLRVAKTADKRTVDPGDTVTYTITVTNVGQVDYTNANPASFTDNLTDVLDDADYNNDAVASSGTVSYAAPVLSWRGSLAAGASATVRYTVTVHDPDTGDRVLANVVVGGMNCPPNSPDPACRTVVPGPHLTVAKAADRTAVLPGDKVVYTITVTNDGAVAFTVADPAQLTDDLTAVLDDATYGNDAAASAGTVSYAAPVLSWSGPLAIGATVTITYSVTVRLPDPADHRMPNRVVAAHSNCATGSTDPACAALVLVRDLTLVKSADHTTAFPGDKVVYTITATNSGQADYTVAVPATFTDDLSNVLDDATYSGDATASVGTVSFAAPILTWSGPLAAGQSAVIRYSVVVNDPPGGDGTLTNVVIGPRYSTCPAGSSNPACTVTVPVPGFPIPPGEATPTPTPTPTPPVFPPPGELPGTGMDVGPLGILAAVLVGSGVVLAVLGGYRRRRGRTARHH